MEPEAQTGIEAAALEVLAEVTDFLDTIGLQEETELSTEVLAEFLMDSHKKDKLLCNQLQIVDFLQNFLAQETNQGLDLLSSEDTNRQKTTAAKEQWKELKATYQEHVEAIRSTITQIMPKVEEVQRKKAQLQEALEQLQTKKQVVMEKQRAAQKQRQLQKEKQLQFLTEVSTEIRNRKAGIQQECEQLYQELEILKQQSVQEQDKLQRHQIFLQLLYTLHCSLETEGKTELLKEMNLSEEKETPIADPALHTGHCGQPGEKQE